MIGWHHRLNEHEFEQTPEVGDGQGSLAWFSPWGNKEWYTTEQLNWADGFSSSHVQMWELDHKESWVLKNWCFWAVVLEQTLERRLDCKEIKPVNPKGNQLWTFIGKTDAEAPDLWPPYGKSWLTGKDPDVGKDWGQEENRETGDETVGWHYWLNGHEFEQTQGDSEGQESLMCCSSWGLKESDLI